MQTAAHGRKGSTPRKHAITCRALINSALIERLGRRTDTCNARSAHRRQKGQQFADILSAAAVLHFAAKLCRLLSICRMPRRAPAARFAARAASVRSEMSRRSFSARAAYR